GVEAPLVGIRGGGVAAQFRAGDDWCARGEGPDRRLRLDGGRRGISAWGGRAPGTWRRGHPQLRRRRPQTGTGRPGTGDPEGGPLNQGFSRSQSMPSDLPKLYLARHGDTPWTDSPQPTGRTDLPLNERGGLTRRGREIGFCLLLTTHHSPEGPHGRFNIEKTHFDPWRRLWGNLHGSPPGRALQAPLGCRDRSGEPGQLSAHDAAAV